MLDKQDSHYCAAQHQHNKKAMLMLQQSKCIGVGAHALFFKRIQRGSMAQCLGGRNDGVDPTAVHEAVNI